MILYLIEYNKSVEKVTKLKSIILEKLKNVKGIKTKFHKPGIKSPKSFVHIISITKSFTYLKDHKFFIGGSIISIAFMLFIGGAIYEGYFQNTSSSTQSSNQANQVSTKSKVTVAMKTPKPSSISPSPSVSPSPSTSSVLGTSDNSGDNTEPDVVTNNEVSVSPVESPIPTLVPVPTNAPSSSSTTSNSSNSNCTTASGVPNSWYSDLYPVSPITASGGSATLTVTIRDCSINPVSKSSTLKISLTSGDSNALVNGQNLPVTITTQNGQASFTVTSQVSGTVGLSIQDTSDSFSVTDTNNNNPSIVFNGQGGPTPVPTDGPTTPPSPSAAPTISPTTSTATPTP